MGIYMFAIKSCGSTAIHKHTGKTTGSDIIEKTLITLTFFYGKAKLVQDVKCQVVQLPQKCNDIYKFTVHDVLKYTLYLLKNNDYVCTDLFKE